MALVFHRSISRKSLSASTVSHLGMARHSQDWEWDYISPLRSSTYLVAGCGWKAPKAEAQPFSFPFQRRNRTCLTAGNRASACGAACHLEERQPEVWVDTHIHRVSQRLG